MADLTEIEASGTTKIAGSDDSGLESNYAEVTPKHDLTTADMQNFGFDHKAVDITTTETPLYAGVANLTDRKELIVENIGNKTIYIGKSGVSSDDLNVNRGITLEIGASRSFPYGDNITLYAITKTGTGRLMIWESN